MQELLEKNGQRHAEDVILTLTSILNLKPPQKQLTESSFTVLFLPEFPLSSPSNHERKYSNQTIEVIKRRISNNSQKFIDLQIL